jgi:hypothetical protein
MAPTRPLVLAAIGAIAAYLTWGVITAGNDAAAPPLQRPITISGGSAAGHRLTTPSWTMLYDHVEVNPETGYFDARGVRDAVIYRQGRPVLHLAAEKIEANLTSKDFTATGHLHAKQSLNGVTRTFSTGSASWVDSTQRLTMPDQIRLQSEGTTLLVDGLTLDMKTGEMHLGALRGEIHQ